MAGKKLCNWKKVFLGGYDSIDKNYGWLDLEVRNERLTTYFYNYTIELLAMTKAVCSRGCVWSEQEDRVLRELCEGRQIKKWRLIVMIMEKEFGIYGKEPKHCRQRYFNHVNSALNKSDWSPEDQYKLVSLYNTYGNRWAAIARALPGRNENSVKNKYNSKIRRALRNISDACEDLKIKRFRERGSTFYANLIIAVSKITNLKRKKRSTSKGGSLSFQEIVRLKKRVLEYQFIQGPLTKIQHQQIIKFIEDIREYLRRISNSQPYTKSVPPESQVSVEQPEELLEVEEKALPPTSQFNLNSEERIVSQTNLCPSNNFTMHLRSAEKIDPIDCAENARRRLCGNLFADLEQGKYEDNVFDF